jgi:hypothetical protein
VSVEIRAGVKNCDSASGRGWNTSRLEVPTRVYKDMRDGSKYDRMIAGISAASLILIITHSLVAMLPRNRKPTPTGSRPCHRTTDETGHAQGVTR